MKGVYFPFAANARELERQIKLKKFDRASTEAVELIKALAPYPGGDDRLRGLHDLDIKDKHQMLIPAFGFAWHPAGAIGLPAFVSQPGVVSAGHYLASAYEDKTALTGEKLSVVFDLRFPLFGPFDGLRVVPTLEDLAENVFGVFQAFAALYSRTLTK